MPDDQELSIRLEELEAEVRRLRDQVSVSTVSPETHEALSRRRLLRGAGLAVAGAAGALASPALSGQAAAANGDSVILGQANTATLNTVVTRTAGSGPAVALANSGDGAPLRLGETPFLGVTVDAGDVLYSEGFFTVGWAPGEEAFVHESSYASYPALFTPFRLLDTRFASATGTNFGRSRVTNPSGKFDASGKLRAGSSINVRLDDFSSFAAGILANFTATGATGGGYLRVWDTGASAPEASILNYTTNVSIANAAMVAVGFDSSDRDSISVDANQHATHVIIDINGLVIGSPLNEVGSFSSLQLNQVQLNQASASQQPRRSTKAQRP